METRSLHYQDEKSDKFWTITLDGSAVSVHFGRVGTAGQRKAFSFDDETAARQAFEKRLAEKLKEGYREAGSSEASVSDQSASAPLSKQLAEEALKICGVPKREWLDPDEVDAEEDQRWLCWLSDCLSNCSAPIAVQTEWRNPVDDVLQGFQVPLAKQGVELELTEADGGLGVVVTADGQSSGYSISAKQLKNCQFHAAVFALDAILPKTVEIFSLALSDRSDSLEYVVLPSKAADRLRQRLGAQFSRCFGKHPAGEFTKLEPKPTATSTGGKRSGGKKQGWDFEKRKKIVRKLYTQEWLASTIESWRAELKNPSKLTSARVVRGLRALGSYYGGWATVSILEGDSVGWKLVHRSWRLSCCGNLIRIGLCQEGRYARIDVYDVVAEMLEAVVLRKDSFARWAYSFLNSNIGKEYVDGVSYGGFLRFTMMLLAKWYGEEPAPVLNQLPPLGIFAQVFEGWDDRERLKAALENICEYHVDQDRRCPDMEYRFQINWAPELLAVARIRKELGLDSPAIEHPFFDTPLSQVPEHVSEDGCDFVEEDLLQESLAYVKRDVSSLSEIRP